MGEYNDIERNYLNKIMMISINLNFWLIAYEEHISNLLKSEFIEILIDTIFILIFSDSQYGHTFCYWFYVLS
jgi:hypothetical protein